MDKAYADTVRLLLTAAPDVFANDIFAMKGGTAIKLFVQDMPRLSVALSPKTADLFSVALELPVLAPAELYGSKLVTAMDRQHPRDMFDGLKMFESGGLSDEAVESFVTYLAGHNRPIHEDPGTPAAIGQSREVRFRSGAGSLRTGAYLVPPGTTTLRSSISA